jgi:predicted small lipoprotein YifL
MAFLAIALVAILILAAVAGCGSKGGTTVVDPIELFKDAQEKVQDVDSLKMSGTVSINLGTDAQQMGIPGSIDIPFEGEVAAGTGTMRDVHLTLDIGFLGALFGGLTGTDTVPSEIELYIVEDTLYFLNPLDGLWYFAAAGEGSFSMIPSGTDFSALLDATDEIDVVKETSDTIEYEVTLDPDKFADLVGGLEDLQLPTGEAPSASDIEQLLKDFVLSVTVDKESGYPVALSFDLSGLSELGGDLGGGFLPTGDVEISLDVEFSDFGKKVSIKLPAEAEDALSIDELFNSFFGSDMFGEDLTF